MTKRAVDTYSVYFRGITVVAKPRTAERTVMRPSAPMAPVKTTNLECLIDIIAAIKNVLSPSSDTMMTDNAAMKPCKKSKLKILDDWRDA